MTDSPEILVADPLPGVRLITLNRPERRNALSNALLGAVADAVRAAADDDAVRAIVLAGAVEVFAAGADLKELQARDLVEALRDRRAPLWAALRTCPKPMLAAVCGLALGGGCELAMHADIVIAGDNARFGQPEINVGIIPGAGGTQRLTRAVGKSLAMQMVLTGEPIDAAQALAAGLVAEVVPREVCVHRAVELAGKIAAKPPLAVRMAKEAVLQSYETTLAAGLDFERRAFHTLFATEDKAEGVAAFFEKRKPAFKGR